MNIDEDDQVPLHLKYIDDLQCSTLDKYKVIEQIGDGLFGRIEIVCMAADTEGRIRLAMKTALRQGGSIGALNSERQEIHALRTLYYEKHVIRLIDIIKLPDRRLSLIMELAVTDLSQITRKKYIYTTMSKGERVTILYQLIRGIAAIHKNGIIHRDIKPSNVLITSNGIIKISDFGLSTPHASSLKKKRLSPYVGTVFYRAPEMLLGDERYNEKVDIWALGCSMTELWTRKICFWGTGERNEFGAICAICGFPELSQWPRLCTLRWYAKMSSMYRDRFAEDRTRQYAMQITHNDEEAADLITKCLEKTPERRIRAEEALNHACFTQTTPALHVTSLLIKLEGVEEQEEAMEN